ncbi:hypothetical protein ACRAWF_21430 [Streptomyces sp. L7]
MRALAREQRARRHRDRGRADRRATTGRAPRRPWRRRRTSGGRRESLTNAAKYSGADRAEVHLARARTGLRVQVRDEGRGGADEAGGSGLLGTAAPGRRASTAV